MALFQIQDGSQVLCTTVLKLDQNISCYTCIENVAILTKQKRKVAFMALNKLNLTQSNVIINVTVLNELKI